MGRDRAPLGRLAPAEADLGRWSPEVPRGPRRSPEVPCRRFPEASMEAPGGPEAPGGARGAEFKRKFQTKNSI